jgi:hypothetical protein
MAKERLILPVKCKHCGSVYDLWYDLQAQEQLREASAKSPAFISFEKRIARLLGKQSLCWTCRKKAVMNMSQGSYDDGAEIGMEFECT